MAIEKAVLMGVVLVILSLIVYVLVLLGIIPRMITPLSIGLVILSGAIIIFVSILPIGYGKKKAFLNIAYALFFFAIISIEVALLKPYFERVGEINLIECKSENFQASEGRDLVRIVLCMFTGYELKEYSAYSVASFIIFYILLPAVFLSVFIYGLMSGLNIGSMFGRSSETILKILSFIIGLYGVRVMFGPFLLTFFAAGFWGLAGLFGAVILTQSLRKIVDNAFIVEKTFSEIKGQRAYERKAAQESASLLSYYISVLEEMTNRGVPPEKADPIIQQIVRDIQQGLGPYSTVTQIVIDGMQKISTMMRQGYDPSSRKYNNSSEILNELKNLKDAVLSLAKPKVKT